MDGLGLQASTVYHVYAFADVQSRPKGFGLYAIPKSTFQCASTAKGNELTATTMTKAYRFTLGSRVRVLHNNVTTSVNDTDWNLGTVSEISSATQIKILMDNNQVWGNTYGATIPVQSSTGGLIEQLSNFHPYTPDNADQSTLFANYRVVGVLGSDGSSNLEGFEILKSDNIKEGTLREWHGDFTGCPGLYTDDWQFMDGLTCKVDESPFIGHVLPDLEGDGRFTRASGTSGTIQSATRVPYNTYRSASSAFAITDSQISNYEDANPTTQNRRTINIDGSTVGANIDVAIRPTNMSVRKLLKVR